MEAASPDSPESPPKRPRLSLQIKYLASGSTRNSRTLAAAVDITTPTAFNTLSNVYATAVDRSTPVQERPPPLPLSNGSLNKRKPVLKLQTQNVGNALPCHTPCCVSYPDTPLSAQPMPRAVDDHVFFGSHVVGTPPMSAAAVEPNGDEVFTFDNRSIEEAVRSDARTFMPALAPHARRRATMSYHPSQPPYTRTRTLRSILRNSPLPPLSTRSPVSPRRQSARLAEKAARRVAYHSPLCQTITTSLYTRSHVDLLLNSATPTTPADDDDEDDDKDAFAAAVGTRDGDQTPGPFEDIKRRISGSQTSTSGGSVPRRGRKREKKRRWMWTIGRDAEDVETDAGSPVNGAESTAQLSVATMVPKLAVPTPRTRPRTGLQVTVAPAGVAKDPGRQRTATEHGTAVAVSHSPSPEAEGDNAVHPISACSEDSTAIASQGQSRSHLQARESTRWRCCSPRLNVSGLYFSVT